MAVLQLSPHATIDIFDWWSLMNPSVAHAVQKLYLHLVQEHSTLYERIYQLDEHCWREILSNRMPTPPAVLRLLEMLKTLHLEPELSNAGRQYTTDRALLALFCAHADGMLAGGVRARLALLQWSWQRLSQRLERKIVEYHPTVVVSTQMIPAALLSAVKRRRGWVLPSVAVTTDFGVHDFWKQPGTDLYCVGHKAIVELPREIDSTRVACTGFPLMPSFTKPIGAAAARRVLDLNPSLPTVLILGGGLGLGVDKVAEQLLRVKLPLQLLVLSGRNGISDRELANRAAHPQTCLKIYGWSERVEVFIRAADLVVGKPGGLTVAEVLACGRPLLATRALRGQEGFNVRFIERHCVGALLSDEELTDRVEFLLTHPDELSSLKTRARELGLRNGADAIAQQILSLTSATARHASEHRIWQHGYEH